MYINLAKEHFQLNKIEKGIILLSLSLLVLMIAVPNVLTILNELGVTVSTAKWNRFLNLVGAGNGLVATVATVFGIAVPGWAAAYIAATGTISA